MNRLRLLIALAAAFLLTAPLASAQLSPETITIHAKAPATPFPHFWEKTFGSGRAILALRESYRNDLRAVRAATGFEYVRFHAIFHDETGVYEEDAQGRPVYNFSYIDQIYDGLLANGVRPFVEISFMPKKLAARQDVHPFWYKQIVAPPKDYAKWDDLIRHFGQHLVERYGIDEVSQWYFEVWNEPNIDFWSGDPKQTTYFELYDHTAKTLKAVGPRLRVGGPSTAAADWVPAFLNHVHQRNIPVDFVSTHGYADDTVENLFHSQKELGASVPVDIPLDQRICAAIKKVHDEIANSTSPNLPLMWTEWNVPSFGDEFKARDTVYVGAALADDIRQCDGLVNMMSYWTFSDVFEENGPVQEPFYGGFGLVAAGGIRKPSYNAFALLHQLGEERLANPSPGVLLTRRKDGTVVAALWNLVDPDRKGDSRSVQFHFPDSKKNAHVKIQRLDEAHGNVLTTYAAMGKPRYPTTTQIAEMNRASALPAAETVQLRDGTLSLDIPVNGLVILEIAN